MKDCLPYTADNYEQFLRVRAASKGEDMPFIADEPLADKAAAMIVAKERLREMPESRDRAADFIDACTAYDEALKEAEPTRKSPERLYQLPVSGDWITIAQVTSVIAHRERHGCGPDVVVISARAGNEGESHSIIPCETYEQACEIRDQIAADRNAAIQGPR